MTARPDRRRPSPPRLPPAPRLPAGPRGAFTLIELLIVVSIIAVLLSLSVAATLAFVTNAREAATRTTLAKVDGKLQRRLQAMRMSLEAGSGDLSRAGGANGALRVKLEQLSKLPTYLHPRPGADGQLGTEDDPIPYSEEIDVLSRVRNGGDPVSPFDTPGYADDPTASSEALLLFLTKGETFGTADTDADAFKESELADTDGDGLREIVDGFGNPIRFYRWPTRLLRPAADADGSGLVEPAEASAQDADGRWPLAAHDPQAGQGEVSAAAAALFAQKLPRPELYPDGTTIVEDADALGGSADSFPFLPSVGSRLRADPDDRYAQVDLEFRSAFSQVIPANTGAPALGQAFERLFHTPATWSMPIAVSAGADGELGLYEPQDRANFGHLAQPREPLAALDNLTTAQGGF